MAVLAVLKQNAIHYGVIFATSFALTLLASADVILSAHGFGAAKAAGLAALIAAAKAGFDAARVAISGPASSKP